MIKKLESDWEYEKKHHLGDYGDSTEYDLYCAFKAGWLAHLRISKKKVTKK